MFLKEMDNFLVYVSEKDLKTIIKVFTNIVNNIQKDRKVK
jgi:hypothetical protein